MYFPYSFWTQLSGANGGYVGGDSNGGDSYIASTLRNGLIGYWTFDAAQNFTGDINNHYNILKDSFSNFPAGKINTCLRTSNVNTVVKSNNLDFSLTDSKHFVGWVNFNNFPSPIYGYISADLFGKPTEYLFSVVAPNNASSPARNLAFIVATGHGGPGHNGLNGVQVSGEFANTGTWYFVSFYYDKPNSSINFSMNNGSVYSASLSGFSPLTGSPSVFFGENISPAVIDNFDAWGVWNRLLTPQEVTYLYAGGGGRYVV